MVTYAFHAMPEVWPNALVSIIHTLRGASQQVRRRRKRKRGRRRGGGGEEEEVEEEKEEEVVEEETHSALSFSLTLDPSSGCQHSCCSARISDRSS